ncbi:MAG: phosphotransferase enzyme family protein [Bacteroidales bacterium]
MLISVFQNFFPETTGVSFDHIPHGHIHDTYIAATTREYIIQRINNSIFKDVDALMANTAQIINFLEKNKQSYSLKIPALYYTTEGKMYYEDQQGNFWRIFSFIPHSQNFQKPPDLEIAAEGGKILGLFSKAVNTLDPGSFNTILPGFHDISIRWDNYQQALNHAPRERFKETSAEIRAAEKFHPMMKEFYETLTHGSIPQRVTHNDTKFNNFLFSLDGKALSIIDLDTVMPGYTLLDYGDAIRTIANSADEDERDSCNVRFNMKLYQEFTRGFLNCSADILSPGELAIMPKAPLYITYLQGLRFLTDHLNGDLYYPVRYFGHNLVRGAVQFTLLKQMEDKLDFITETIEKFTLQNPV